MNPPAQSISQPAEQVLARCKTLARLSSMSDGICRTYLSPEHAAANAAVIEWMGEAGMEVYVDAVGNVRGRYSAAQELSLIHI